MFIYGFGDIPIDDAPRPKGEGKYMQEKPRRHHSQKMSAIKRFWEMSDRTLNKLPEDDAWNKDECDDHQRFKCRG